MTMRFQRATAMVVGLFALACDARQLTPTAPQFDFTNGPSDLPNVFRGDSLLLFAWADSTTDLVIVINAPVNGVHDLRVCGGQLRPEFQPVQTVGGLQGVLRQLRILRDVNIHLYRPVPPGFTGVRSLCEARPFASGRGNLTSTDNDRLVTGEGANAFGNRAQAKVALVEGGSAHLTAHRQALVMPDGTLELLVSSVVLH